MTWDSSRWLTEFRRSGADHRQLRAKVFRDTVALVRARGFAFGDRTVPLDDAGQYEALYTGTRLYDRTTDLAVASPRARNLDTKVSVIGADCLEVARLMSDLGLNPVVLNMANRNNPGGGVKGGAGAQEENIFRRSNLFYSMFQFVDYGDQYDVPRAADRSYPMGRASGAIYSPGATVFRSSEATGYALLPEPYAVSVVSVPAIFQPATKMRMGQRFLTGEMADATRLKIRAILRVAAHHGHDSAVLSAFGCGAFCNPPFHIAMLFREMLDEAEFQSAFAAVSFAIIDDHNAHQAHNPEGNLVPFQRVFS